MANELILVVEDNDKNRKLVRDVLTFKGYEIIEAETGGRGRWRKLFGESLTAWNATAPSSSR